MRWRRVEGKHEPWSRSCKVNGATSVCMDGGAIVRWLQGEVDRGSGCTGKAGSLREASEEKRGAH
eukprot:470652-Hanusia_phi.AAC.1